MRNRSRLALIPIFLVASLCVCASASATVTVGSPLAGPFTQGACDASGGCTIADLALVAPGPPVASPVTGRIIRWRVVGATPLPGYAIRALGRGAGTLFTGAVTSTPVTPSGGGVETFAADLPIKAGEYVGLNVPEDGGIDGINPGGQYAALVPELPDGGSANALEETGEIAFNADVLAPPTLGAVSPSTGTTAGGTSVVIAGSEFAEVKGVSFGAAAAGSYTVDSEGQITAVAPATGSAGPVDVTVTTVAGTTSVGGADRFTYSAPAATPVAAPASPVPECVVPKLTGKKLKLAKKKIRYAHCRLGLVSRKLGVNAKTGKVVRQVPKAGKV